MIQRFFIQSAAFLFGLDRGKHEVSFIAPGFRFAEFEKRMCIALFCLCHKIVSLRRKLVVNTLVD